MTVIQLAIFVIRGCGINVKPRQIKELKRKNRTMRCKVFQDRSSKIENSEREIGKNLLPTDSPDSAK